MRDEMRLTQREQWMTLSLESVIRKPRLSLVATDETDRQIEGQDDDRMEAGMRW